MPVEWQFHFRMPFRIEPEGSFFVASDHDRAQFVHKVSAVCRGKAYFTTPDTLQYLLMDYMQHKSRTIH